MFTVVRLRLQYCGGVVVQWVCPRRGLLGTTEGVMPEADTFVSSLDGSRSTYPLPRIVSM